MLKKMTRYLELVIRKVMKEKSSERSPRFTNSKDAITWLNSQK